MTKASNNEFPSVLFGELAAAPTTPAAGKWRLYTKAGGLYYVDDAGTEIGPLAAAGAAPAFSGARYTSNAGQTLVDAAAVAIINFEDQVYDTDSAVTIGASWKYTAPATGYYHIDVFIMFGFSSGWAAGERALLQLYKGGALLATLERKDDDANAAAASAMTVTGSITVNLTAAEYIDVRLAQNSGGNIALDTNAGSVWINIDRVG